MTRTKKRGSRKRARRAPGDRLAHDASAVGTAGGNDVSVGTTIEKPRREGPDMRREERLKGLLRELAESLDIRSPPLAPTDEPTTASVPERLTRLITSIRARLEQNTTCDRTTKPAIFGRNDDGPLTRVSDDIDKLLERYLEAEGVPESVRSETAIEILWTVARAKGELLSSLPPAAMKPPLPELTAKQVAAIKQRAKDRPWAERPNRRTTAFEWVRDNFAEWIPGLVQKHLKADHQLYDAFRVRVHREGLPDWLDVPSEADANLRSVTDPDERKKLLATRETIRDRVRQIRSLAKS